MPLLPSTPITKILTAARDSLGGLLIQILSIASAVGLGIYGEGLWQERQDEIETNRLISAIATEMAENRAKILQFMFTLDYWSSDEAMQTPLAHTEGRWGTDTISQISFEGGIPHLVESDRQSLPEDFPAEFLLPDVAALLPAMLEYVPERIVWKAAQYQREFSGIKVGCLRHIQAINRSHDELASIARNRLLTLFKEYAKVDDKSPEARKELRRVIAVEVKNFQARFDSPVRAYISDLKNGFLVSLNDCDLTPREFRWTMFQSRSAQLEEIEDRDRFLTGENGEQRQMLFALYPAKNLLQDETGNFNPSSDENSRQLEFKKKADEIAKANPDKTVHVDADGNITIQDESSTVQVPATE